MIAIRPVVTRAMLEGSGTVGASPSILIVEVSIALSAYSGQKVSSSGRTWGNLHARRIELEAGQVEGGLEAEVWARVNISPPP